MKIKIKAVALPAGVAERSGTLRLSIFLSPTIYATRAGETGSSVPISATDLSKWPDFVNGTEFSVLLDGIGVQSVRVSAAAKRSIWDSLITPLKAELQDENATSVLTGAKMFLYKTQQVYDQLKSLYSGSINAAQAARVLIPSNDVTAFLTGAPEFTLYPTVKFLAGDSSFGQIAGVENCSETQPAASRPRTVFDELIDFHSRTFEQQQEAVRKAEASTSAANSEDLFEFHRRFSELGQYPPVMRKLGFIVDLDLGSQALPKAGKVAIAFKSAPFELVKTSTNYSYDSAKMRFSAGNQMPDPSLVDGFLALENQNLFGLVQIDVPGSGAKAVSFANNVQCTRLHPTGDTPQTMAPPSLRSSGIAVLKHDHPKALMASAERQLDHEKTHIADANAEISLNANDVIRGYRAQVRAANRTNGRWFSVCSRRVKLSSHKGSLIDEFEDEGWVTPSIAKEGTPIDPRIYIPDSLFSWQGWALAAPRPAKALPRENSSHDEMATNEDRAGRNGGAGSTVLRVTAPTHSNPPLRFGYRYRIRASAVDLAGNSLSGRVVGDLEHATDELTYKRFDPIEAPMVVPRDSLSKSPGEKVDYLVIRSNYDDNSKEESERHLAPPKTSVEMATLHGMFDRLSADESYAMVEARADGALPKEFGYVELPLPYLPDPLARGLVFQGLPNGPEVLPVEFNGTWPNLRTLRIRVKEGDQPAKWDKNGSQIIVSLKKAAMAAVKVCSLVRGEDLKFMGLVDWISTLTPDEAESGKLWMLTPSRVLFLIHAIRQPLIEPRFYVSATGAATLSLVLRKFDDTTAKLQGELHFDARSSGKLDIEGQWIEEVDDPEICAPETRSRVQNIFTHNVDYRDADTVGFGIAAGNATVEHTFGDTKHRTVTYSAMATTRFLENFIAKDEKIDSGSAEFLKKYARRTPEADLPSLTLSIPSTARPLSCAVKYAIPLFGWTKLDEDEHDEHIRVARERLGGALRIFLERGWYSSGNGELLGVVLRSGPEPKEDQLKPFVSGWGGDPIWKSGQITEYLQPKHFLSAITIPDLPIRSFTLQELSGDGTKPYSTEHRVTVVPHRPVFDESRQLWYCDIRINPGTAYLPFVRLSIARFQPYSVFIEARGSIRDCHLSRVVITDLIQLTPDRSAVLSFPEHHTKEVSVTISGATYEASSAENGPATIDVTLEKSDKDSGLGWKPVVTNTLKPSSFHSGIVSWVGSVTLPEKRKKKRFRLVIREFETFMNSSGSKVKRLVYAEVLPI